MFRNNPLRQVLAQSLPAALNIISVAFNHLAGKCKRDSLRCHTSPVNMFSSEKLIAKQGQNRSESEAGSLPVVPGRTEGSRLAAFGTEADYDKPRRPDEKVDPTGATPAPGGGYVTRITSVWQTFKSASSLWLGGLSWQHNSLMAQQTEMEQIIHAVHKEEIQFAPDSSAEIKDLIDVCRIKISRNLWNDYGTVSRPCLNGEWGFGPGLAAVLHDDPRANLLLNLALAISRTLTLAAVNHWVSRSVS